jgi:imidazolonepropionase-like amidohydrolase
MQAVTRILISAAVVTVGALALPVLAQGPTPTSVVFENVRIFDGTSDRLSGPSNVLVTGNVIKTISNAPIADPPGTTVQRIRGNGRTLMPGLIDNHWHAMMVRPTPNEFLLGDPGHINLLAGAEATATLLRGFTTVRDVGGPSFGLKQAIDEGTVVGPRIFPSGAVISVTSGHGDFRQPFELPRTVGTPMSRQEVLGASAIADSPDEVRVRVREQLMKGASQIKLTAGGGVASPHSPLDASTFTLEELRAAVEAAENWNTYVCTHAYTPRSIQRAIAAGVKVIEHGHLMDEATAKLMAEKGIWLSTQTLPEELANVFPPGAPEREQLTQVLAGTDTMFTLAKKYKIKTAWGTDIAFSPQLARTQGAMLAKMLKWYTPPETLAMVTSINGQLLALSGKRNPYPGRLGVVQEGALADLLLIDGDPLSNIALIGDPEKNLLVIMKDGRVYKNSVPK